MRSISYLLLVFMLGCRSNNDNAIGPERSADAFVYDSSMYADGCELHLRLDSGTTPNDGVQYKFAAASISLIRRTIAEASLDPKEMVNLPVTIRYQETTKKSVIACGWVSPTVTEINVLAISRR